MTYRVVKIEPCDCGEVGDGSEPVGCMVCGYTGTRMVDVCEIERAPDWWWSPTEQAATAGTWGHGDDRAVWVEVES